jgi:acyl transferase domain-containing protein
MPSNPIAVIGLACRFPGAPDPAAFWNLLLRGGEAIGPPTTTRLSALQDATCVPKSGYLEKIEAIDASFFGLSQAATASLTPRQALLLELAWEVLEDGGQPPNDLRGGPTGVFLGSMWHSGISKGGSLLDREAGMISGRVSHQFGFRGPSILVDTSTSSSLVAVHLACQSLSNGESDLALAGGVSLFDHAQEWTEMEALGTLAADGRCRPFDQDANGYVRGEGGGLVLLKPLEDALRDHDRIYCVIQSTATNHNGETAGLPIPSAGAQQDLFERAYRSMPAIEERIAYIEAHGTGTRAGDEAEWRALESFFATGRGGRLTIGSVKANIGHLEGAAGIAGLVKVALAAHHAMIPATINVAAPRFKSAGLSVLRDGARWPAGFDYAGVTSLGLNGTNCHVVVARPPGVAARSQPAPPWLFVMSARTEAALEQYTEALIRWANTWTDADLPDVCYTAAMRRSHSPVRRAFCCQSIQEFVDALRGRHTSSGNIELVARSFERGGDVDWRHVFPVRGQCISLPPYPWQRGDASDSNLRNCPTDIVPRLVADVLHLRSEVVDHRTRLIELGLDSLTALELEAQLEVQVGLQVLAPELLGPLTVRDLIQKAESASARSQN